MDIIRLDIYLSHLFDLINKLEYEAEAVGTELLLMFAKFLTKN